MMRIAVIGTGNVGSALGGAFARAGHEVTFAARDDAKAGQVAAANGAGTAPVVEAVQEAEVIVLAIPYGSLDEVAATIAPAAEGKVVIDVTNPLTPDYSGLANVGGPSAAEQAAATLEGARVVKAFNTQFSQVQGNPALLGTKLDALYAADDEAAARTVAELAASIGFRPVRVGPLAAARELEALAWLNIRLQMVASGNWQSAFVLVAPPEQAVTA
jgi:predicted dinucleotide-binding enzyme